MILIKNNTAVEVKEITEHNVIEAFHLVNDDPIEALEDRKVELVFNSEEELLKFKEELKTEGRNFIIPLGRMFFILLKNREQLIMEADKHWETIDFWENKNKDIK